MVLAQFRQRYPQGSLVSELVDIDRGICIVRVSVIVNESILATGLAGADRVETAEDLARERAIALLMLDSYNTTNQAQNSPVAESKTPKDTVINSSQTSPPIKSAPPLTIAHQQVELTDNNITENSNVVDFADYPAKESQSYSVPSPPNVEPKINTESAEEVVKPQPEAILNSANLFEGASNPDILSQDISQDGEIMTETSSDTELPQSNTLPEVNFNEIKHQTDLEIKRLGWTRDDGREFLKSHYGKRSRLQLTDDQLLEFLQYLASQPSPS